jgi:hypothetical protein
MGSVASRAALVTGGLEVHGDSIRLLSNTSITAYDQAAPIALDRGGEVLVCATSQFHLLHSGQESSLVFALDRGAFELRGLAQPQDTILTPDLRFTLASSGHFDLSLRVTPNGDTCVQNAGAGAPILQISDAFSNATYRLTPGQHVLFEQGSLRTVVDSESSSCGCPPIPAALSTLSADATPAERSAAEHPFPAAASQGLAPTVPIDNSAPAGEKHTQVSSTLAFGGIQPDSTAVPPSPRPAATAAPTQRPPAPPGAHDIVHAIGHFFHRLFHPNPPQAGSPNP